MILQNSARSFKNWKLIILNLWLPFLALELWWFGVDVKFKQPHSSQYHCDCHRNWHYCSTLPLRHFDGWHFSKEGRTFLRSCRLIPMNILQNLRPIQYLLWMPSKHLKGQLRPRVCHVTFLDQRRSVGAPRLSRHVFGSKEVRRGLSIGGMRSKNAKWSCRNIGLTIQSRPCRQ